MNQVVKKCILLLIVQKNARLRTFHKKNDLKVQTKGLVTKLINFVLSGNFLACMVLVLLQNGA